MSKRIDNTYTAKYIGGVTINPLAVLKEEIEFVNGETNEEYFPDTGYFYFDRPDLNKRFVLTGTFDEEPLGPEPTGNYTYHLTIQNAGGQFYDDESNLTPVPYDFLDRTGSSPYIVTLSDVLPQRVAALVTDSSTVTCDGGEAVLSSGTLTITATDTDVWVRVRLEA